MSARRVIQGKRKIARDEDGDGDDNKVGSSRSEALLERIKGMEFNLQQLRKKEYCDVTLRTTSDNSPNSELQEPIYGHRIVLKSASPYFESLMWTSDDKKSDFKVEGIQKQTLEFLLDCIYNCNVGPIEKNVFEVCAGAKLLQLPAIQDACEVFIENSRTISNCLQIWTFGRQQDCRRLKDSRFILKNFAAVSKTTDFISLTNEEVEALISSSLTRPMVISANDLLLSLHRWVIGKGDETPEIDQRINSFLSLVRKLPREDLDQHIFAQVFIEDSRLKNDAECQKFRDEYLCEFFRRHIQDQKSNGSANVSPTKKSERSKVPAPILIKIEDDGEEEEEVIKEIPASVPKRRGRPKTVHAESPKPATKSSKSSESRSTPAPVAVPPQKRLKKSERSLVPFTCPAIDAHCVAYYISQKGNDWILNSYDLQTGENKAVGNFLHYRENGALLVLNNFIYFLGGRAIYGGPGTKPGEDSNKIDTFDLTTGEWNCSGDLLEMDEGRSFFNCTILDNYIYIIAGFREDACIDSVERIPINSSPGRELAEVTNVKWAKNRSPVAVLNGKIYSTGGIVADGKASAWASDFAECYDPVTNKWTSISRMRIARVGHAVAVFGSKLYVIGGGKSEEPVDALKLNTVEAYDPGTNTWEYVAQMHKKRQFGTAISYGGFILALGGDSAKNPTAERYNPQKDRWEMVDTGYLPSDADYTTMIFKVQQNETK